MLRTGLTAILLLALLAASSCGGGMATARDAAFIPVASLDRDNSIGADNAQVALLPVGNSYEVAVSGLVDGKAVYGEVAYDPSLVHLTEATVSDGSSALADGTVSTGDQLVLIVDQPDKNRVLFGMVLANWPDRDGIDGNLTLATLTFAAGATQSIRTSAKAPGPQNYNAIDLQAAKNGTENAVLTWKEALAGDGGNDGEVGIADLTPLGARLNDTSGSSPAIDADYDKNGQPNIADLSALGAQLGATLGGYKVMAAPTPTGTFTEVADITRATEHPTKPPLGEVTWDWTSPAPLVANTSYKVVPYDNTANKELGRESDVESLTGAPIQTMGDIDRIEFEDPNGVVLDNGGTPQIILIEESVDGVADNVPMVLVGDELVPEFALEHLQLRAIGEYNEEPGVDVDFTDTVLWYVTAGGGLADIDNDATGGKGDLTFNDRGTITITAQESGDFTNTASITFELLSIEQVDLQTPGGSPTTVAAGDSVPFTVMGTFDSDDNIASGNEQVIDITEHVSWATIVDVGPSSAFAINQTTGELETAGASPGDQARVSAEYPKGGAVPQLNDNQRRYSPYVQVNVN